MSSDKFFENCGLPPNAIFPEGGSLNVVHQLGEEVEAGFVCHFMLTEFLRRFSQNGDADNARVLLVLNQHSKQHWASIGNKLGTNFSALEEKGTLVIVDMMRELYNGLKSLKDSSSPGTSSSSGFDLDSLYIRCQQICSDFQQKGSGRILVVIEDLTNFLDIDSEDPASIQNSERKLTEFLLKLRALSLLCHEESRCAVTVACLVQSPQISSESVNQARFAQTISASLPSILFQISPLSTGFSTQVTGFVRVVCKLTCALRNPQPFTRNFHFKLENNCARVTPL